ncbi:uncharacterized protein J3D65DRAFT_332528 [Phyllosticta citribraziliensis]|uniref:Fatty acid hydroxylase domain-containing protein n=1 Tax=Phyllosticta citribraziliensis TaxID=989973 RepID=A0ABR1LV38_9PEZI
MLETILGLPLLSYIFLPIYTSWSTRLNILFFMLTWSMLLVSYPPWQVEALGTLAVRTIFFMLPALASLLLDTGIPSLAVAIKAQGEFGLPGRLGPRRLLKLVGWSVFNVLLGVALQLAIELFATKLLRVRSALRVAKTLPAPYEIAKHVGGAFLLRGILQYYIHRHLLHRQHSRLAKYHRDWALSIRAPFALAATYDHPLCYLLHHWLPLFVPAAVFRCHVLTYQLLLALVSLEEFFVYSGYSVLPSGIMLSGMARRADTHALTGGKGNYAPLGVLDWLHGTSVGSDVSDDVRQELEKHDVKQKAGNAVDGATSKLNVRKGRK